jgi:uncharacterized repeat protein (TIGR04052 family)
MRRLLALALLPLFACTDGGATIETQPVTVGFDARFGAAPVACGEVYDAPFGSSATVELLDLRLYVSEPMLLTDDGREVPLLLTADEAWQTETVALLDFEDGSAGCSASGNAQTNTTLTGEAEIGTYTGLKFLLGLPFAENHADPLAAKAPLNVASMFWSWQTGHKFVRAEFRNDAPAPDNQWLFHLGSTGCTSEAAVRAPDAPCEGPNLAQIALESFDPDTSTVILDVASLLDQVDVGADTPGSNPGCMSSPVDVAECAPIYANLGLDFETGACTNGCADQQAFSVE